MKRISWLWRFIVGLIPRDGYCIGRFDGQRCFIYGRTKREAMKNIREHFPRELEYRIMRFESGEPYWHVDLARPAAK